jgi:hypothetical protein
MYENYEVGEDRILFGGNGTMMVLLEVDMMNLSGYNACFGGQKVIESASMKEDSKSLIGVDISMN